MQTKLSAVTATDHQCTRPNPDPIVVRKSRAVTKDSHTYLNADFGWLQWSNPPYCTSTNTFN